MPGDGSPLSHRTGPPRRPGDKGVREGSRTRSGAEPCPPSLSLLESPGTCAIMLLVWDGCPPECVRHSHRGSLRAGASGRVTRPCALIAALSPPHRPPLKMGTNAKPKPAREQVRPYLHQPVCEGVSQAPQGALAGSTRPADKVRPPPALSQEPAGAKPPWSGGPAVPVAGEPGLGVLLRPRLWGGAWVVLVSGWRRGARSQLPGKTSVTPGLVTPRQMRWLLSGTLTRGRRPTGSGPR